MAKKKLRIATQPQIDNEKRRQIAETRMSRYEELKNKLINNALEYLGFDYRTDYHLPKGFSFFENPKVSREQFKEKYIQNLVMPFTDEQIIKFLSCKKKAVSTGKIPFAHISSDGVKVYNHLLVSIDSNKVSLFRICVLDKGTPDNFGIKFDMLVGGKEWMQLIRYDAAPNATHDNLVKNKLTDETFVPTPHVHIASEQAQIIFYDRFEMFAKSAVKTFEKLQEERFNQLDEVLNMLGKFLNIEDKILNHEPNNNQYLFETTSENWVSSVEDVMGKFGIQQEDQK